MIREQEASAIRRAYDLVLAGESLESIARTWNAAGLPAGQEGLPQRTGQRGEWSPDAVRAVLMSRGYAGPAGVAGAAGARQDGPAGVAGAAGARQDGPADPAAPTPVVSRDVWRAAADTLAQSSGPTSAEPAPALLTALAHCGICGRPVQSQLVSAGQVAYRCDGDDGRTHLARSAAPIDSWIRLLAIERLGRPDAPDLLGDPDQPDLYALRAHSGGLRARRAQLEDAVTDGTVDQPEAAAGSARLDAEFAKVEDQMIDHSRRDVPTSLTGADPVEAAWDRLATSRQRGILLALTERIALHPVPEGRRAGDPDVMRVTVIVGWRTT
jgi:site-specific DNA recombinase